MSKTLEPLNPPPLEPLKEGWRWVRLGEVCSVHPGQHILESDYNRNGIGVGYLTGPDDFGEIYPGIKKWTDKPKAWCTPGDVLVTVKGAGVGKTNIAPNERVAIGRQLMAIRPKSELLDQIYLYYGVVTQLSKLQSKAIGSTVPGLSRENIESIKIALPPLGEQKHIAAKLQELMQEIKRARTACEKQLEAAKALPAAYLREVFESEEAKKWERKRLGEAIQEAQPGFACGKRAGMDGFVQLRMNNITSQGKLDLSSILRVPATHEQIERYKLLPGDVIFNNTNSVELVGKTTLFNEQTGIFLYSNHLTRLRPKTDILDSLYLASWLQIQWYRRIFELNCNRWIGQAAVQREKLLDFEIPVPPLPEQKHIASKLQEMILEVERAQTVCEKQVEAINALPQAILRKAFRGKL